MRMCDVEVKIHNESETGWFVSTDGNRDAAVWVDKEKPRGTELEIDEGQKGWAVITMPEWYAVEKGLV